eukprot:CAMPEP_0174880054 /NCGR_PEP_ID=MMETSP1114-20130205/83565_1 /TAXON_ID=312471 /ORGANISM="Neobodo designis, Strain CCAP 1951/1" /LENGTH=952 /DNA_ID=CAMNT_0016115449 /DNA_START=56 /DNA_END=2914 /DNA_ORIENTATION=-
MTSTTGGHAYTVPPVADGANSQQPPRRPRSRPFVSMRLAISAFFAITVVAVSVVTFTITYLASLDTVEAVGRSYAGSLATTARAQTKQLFHVPAIAAVSLAQALRRYEGFRLPTDDPTTWSVLERTMDAVARSFTLATDDTFLATVIFDDGSRVSVGSSDPVVPGEFLLTVTALHAGSIDPASATRCCGTPRQREYFLSNMSRVRYDVPRIQPLEDARNALYTGLRGLVSRRETGFWNRFAYNNLVRVPSFAVGLVYPLRNETDFIGVFISSIGTAQISVFLAELDVTPNTVSFALDFDGAIVATTHRAPFSTFENTTDPATGVLPANCFHTATINPGAAVHVVACRALAQEFPYEPLRAVAGDESMRRPPVDTPATIRTVDTSSDGVVIAAAAAIPNIVGQPPITLLLFMPQSDILGPIVRTRNVVVGVVAATVVLASLLSFAFTSFVLGALDRVSAQMSQTAKLRDRHNDSVRGNPVVKGNDDSDGDGADDSAFAEIYDIQRAYGDMAIAIGSFTRYVPRDVVRDLMQSGELCRLAMSERRCTIMFTDIAGFTTMCERVPTADLSQLVHAYFECMTRHVGRHGGIVDKFVGDAIMAVWGAGFTSMCERVATDQLGELVRLYFERMTALVMGHAGLVDKYIGDAIMAVWGAPFRSGNPEVRATLCAMRMARETKVAPLAPLFDNAGELLRIRVGIATGEVLAGNMGSAERMSYTVIGDAVNLASRLEGFCKVVGAEIVVCETTATELEDAITVRLLVKLRAAGKLTGVRVFEPLGVASRVPPADLVAAFRNDEATADPTMSDGFSVSSFADTTDDASNAGAGRRPSRRATSEAAAATVSQSTTGGFAIEDVRIRGEQTVALYETAARMDPFSLVADDETKAAATAFTKAADAFIAGNFTRTLAFLNDVHGPLARRFDLQVDGGCVFLRDRAEQEVAAPSVGFDGTVAAREK